MDNYLNVFELYADANENKIKNFNTKISSSLDVEIESTKPRVEKLWISKMEDTIPYLEKILTAPTKLIINEEEVVKIEKIKKVTVESIKHLSKNAGLIEDVEENGDVKPGKLLNVFKEETLNTYENRFIYTLIQKMMYTTKKELEKIKKEKSNAAKELKKINYNAKTMCGKDKVELQLCMASSTDTSNRNDEMQDTIDRMEALYKTIISLTLTTTYQTWVKEKVSIIQPPLQKNNVILKNVNFQYAAKLWDFLINEMDKKSDEDLELENKSKKFKETGRAKKMIDETFLLDYLILQDIDNPQKRKEHKKELMERIIANMVEKTLDVNENLTEEQLKNVVSKQYKIIKYKHQATNKEVQEIFKKYISKYVEKVTKGEKR